MKKKTFMEFVTGHSSSNNPYNMKNLYKQYEERRAAGIAPNDLSAENCDKRGDVLTHRDEKQQEDRLKFSSHRDVVNHDVDSFIDIEFVIQRVSCGKVSRDRQSKQGTASKGTPAASLPLHNPGRYHWVPDADVIHCPGRTARNVSDANLNMRGGRAAAAPVAFDAAAESHAARMTCGTDGERAPSLAPDNNNTPAQCDSAVTEGKQQQQASPTTYSQATAYIKSWLPTRLIGKKQPGRKTDEEEGAGSVGDDKTHADDDNVKQSNSIAAQQRLHLVENIHILPEVLAPAVMVGEGNNHRHPSAVIDKKGSQSSSGREVAEREGAGSAALQAQIKCAKNEDNKSSDRDNEKSNALVTHATSNEHTHRSTAEGGQLHLISNTVLTSSPLVPDASGSSSTKRDADGSVKPVNKKMQEGGEDSQGECGVVFGRYVQTRHHCRYCGGIFCDACCPTVEKSTFLSSVGQFVWSFWTASHKDEHQQPSDSMLLYDYLKAVGAEHLEPPHTFRLCHSCTEFLMTEFMR